MATKTTSLNIRIEPDVKEQAEAVFRQLGISSSIAVNMFFKQVILQRGMPFELKTYYPHVPDMTNLSPEEKKPAKATQSRPRRCTKPTEQTQNTAKKPVITTVKSLDKEESRMEVWEKSHAYKGI